MTTVTHEKYNSVNVPDISPVTGLRLRTVKKKMMRDLWDKSHRHEGNVVDEKEVGVVPVRFSVTDTVWKGWNMRGGGQ